MIERWLILYPGNPREKSFPLQQATLQVGRDASAGLRLDTPSVSARHASVVCTPTRTTLVDLESTNGTFLNGKRIQTTDLKNGDRIRLANVEIIYREESRTAPAPTHTAQTDTLFTGRKLHSSRMKSVLRDLLESGRITRDCAGDLSEEWELLEESMKRTDSLYRILEHTFRITEKPLLIETILQEIKDILELDVAGLYSVDEERFYVLEADQVKEEEKTETLSETVLERTLQTAKPIFLQNIGEDSRVVGFQSLMQFKIQALICVPLLGRDSEARGVLYCVSKNRNRLSVLEKDEEFLQACSSVVTLSLENLSLLTMERVNAHNSERKRQEGKFYPVIQKLQTDKENLSFKLASSPQEHIIGSRDSSLNDLIAFVSKAAKTDLPVLLTGETGVGKSMWAREIHNQSGKDKAFGIVDCTTLPAELLESELFGHEKGAFTGAVSKKQGKVAAADGGTLFIDEIGELPLPLQGKLLRLVHEGEYELVGGTQTQKNKARLVFATNRDLEEEIRLGKFRQDLYYRLNVLKCRIKPLREIGDFIPVFVQKFLSANRQKINPGIRGVSDEALQLLQGHSWPGNIRELENCILRGMFNAQGEQIETENLELSPDPAGTAPVQPADDTPSESLDLKLARENLDRAFIQKALAKTGRNVSRASKELHISRNALMELIKKYGL